MFQRSSIEELHHDEGPLPASSDLVDSTDVGVIESRGGSCLAAEALESLGILSQLFGQEFQGDKAAQFEILSFVDHSHTSTADSFEEAVVGDGRVHW